MNFPPLPPQILALWVGFLCHRCIVGGGGELCLAVGTSQKSKQPNIPQFLTLGTAVWAMQTALSLGRESLERGNDQSSPTPSMVIMTSPLPLPSHPDPVRAFSLAWLRAACSPCLADSQHLPYFTGQGGWRHARARLTSAAACLGKGEGRVSREACSLAG